MNATETTEAMRALLAAAAHAEAQGDREAYARALKAAILLAEGASQPPHHEGRKS